ncbi:MAG: leucine--tRNA ligase [Flavobacteriales bacterium]
MEYDFRSIEGKWQEEWRKRNAYAVREEPGKRKYYVLDMFPYPSGAGLHVGHPLGYIASDIIARYRRHQGFNVLHPMGYDSFGLPAEQYAIQTGQHPEKTTVQNIARYREQLDKIGFSFDWSREVRTSDPQYYRWTQWIFSLIYESWYNKDTDRAEPIHTLIAHFEANGNYNVNAAVDDDWFRQMDRTGFVFGADWDGTFSATDWNSMSEELQQRILMQYRLTYLADSMVNWCPALGTVLANDEVKDGVSERGGHPVEQKLMRQWSMRISAYAERLLSGLETIEWPENIKEIQRNWIGRSEGARVQFAIDGHPGYIEVFTTRPDTIFGVSFMTLAPEHELVVRITTPEYREAVEKYIAAAKLKTERDRQAEVKHVTGQFTGAFAIHPFTGEQIPVWIGEYVLAGYGTGAVMAVPAGDQRDFDFARKFNLPVPAIFEGGDLSEKAETSKDAVLTNSDFLNGLSGKQAMKKVIAEIESRGIGEGKINYRMRDAVFSRQRYWGEPIPVYFDGEVPHLVPDSDLPVTLPPVDKYLPTEDGEPPLARAVSWDYNGKRREYNTMPGWAGSSWYFLRYMDPNNPGEFASRHKVEYWGQVDLYMGGAEHATGHLLYSRFWTKVLFDLGYIGFDEPFKKMINQGMITGRSSKLYRLKVITELWGDGEVLPTDLVPTIFLSKELHDNLEREGNEGWAFQKIKNELSSLTERLIQANPNYAGEVIPHQYLAGYTSSINVDIALVDNDVLDIEGLRAWRPEYKDSLFIRNDEERIICDWEIEKMSKSKFNVQTPDELVEKFGADTLRCYEMFLGPVEQSKPWDTKGINGVHNFLRKFWRLFHDKSNAFAVSDDAPSKEELKTLHKTIKKVTEDLNRYSWNTVVSTMMIGVNELTDLQCNKRAVLEPMCVLLSPYAPHMAEELWQKLGHPASITEVAWPAFDEAHLTESSFDYPVSFNGKTRFFVSLPVDWNQEQVTAAVMEHEGTAKYLEGKAPKKVIVVPKRIVNVVV